MELRVWTGVGVGARARTIMVAGRSATSLPAQWSGVYTLRLNNLVRAWHAAAICSKA